MKTTKSNLILPFTHTNKITILVNEQTGQTHIDFQKPMDHNIVFDVLVSTLKGAMNQTITQLQTELAQHKLGGVSGPKVVDNGR